MSLYIETCFIQVSRVITVCDNLNVTAPVSLFLAGARRASKGHHEVAMLTPDLTSFSDELQFKEDINGGEEQTEL